LQNLLNSFSLKVEDISIGKDGIYVTLLRKKAGVSRSLQTIWVNKTFFWWDLSGNLETYLKYIPPEGSLWRTVAPHPKEIEKHMFLLDPL